MDQNPQVARPLVSITMPAYNCGPFVRQAIESVCAQTYQNWELIIIDDASTDNTAEMITAVSDPRIRVYTHTENQGIEKTRNEALTLVNGTYIAVLDGDDVWLDEHKLEKQVAFLEDNPACVVVGTFLTHLTAAGVQSGSKSYATDDAAIRDRMLLQNQFAHSSVLMRREAVEKTEGYRGDLAEDLDLFLQLGLHGTFANIPKYMTGYRMHGTGASSKKLAMARALDKMITLHSAHYPNALLAILKNYARVATALLRLR